MKKLIIVLMFFFNFGTNYAMESNLNTKNSDTANNKKGYFSLQEEDYSEEDSDNAISHKKEKEKIITIYQQNSGMVLPGNWVVINEKHESIKIRIAKATWKTYCTPKGFKNCACGALAIFIMISLYKLAMLAEKLTSQDSISI